MESLAVHAIKEPKVRLKLEVYNGWALAHNYEVPLCRCSEGEYRSILARSIFVRSSQVRMFFSSGIAHTKGGGEFCIETYSVVKRLLAALDAIGTLR